MEILRAPNGDGTPRPSFVDQYPGPEDWVALQGGKPRVFYQPTRPAARWLVVHVYEEHDDYEHRFQSGIIVDTLPPDLDHSVQRLYIDRVDADDQPIRRNIAVPSFMNRNVHGNPCQERTGKAGSSAQYERIKSQDSYERRLRQWQETGWRELRFSVGNNGFRLLPLDKIRPSRPLN